MDGHNNYSGRTDENGKYTVESHSGGSSEIVITKEGFYPSRPEVEWDGNLNSDIDNLKKFGFRPWNHEVHVVLKRIGKPIPMIVRYSGFHSAPKFGEDIGFDLLVGDWVKPNGKGVVSDLLIRFDSMFTSEAYF